MSASGKPFDPYDGAFFCRHCLTQQVPPRFCNRPLLLQHLADEHGIIDASDESDIVYGWYDALEIRERYEQERDREHDAAAAGFAGLLAELESVDEFLARCASEQR